MRRLREKGFRNSTLPGSNLRQGWFHVQLTYFILPEYGREAIHTASGKKLLDYSLTRAACAFLRTSSTAAALSAGSA